MACGFDAQVGADGTHRGSDELTVFGEHLDCFRVCVCVCVCVKSDPASSARLGPSRAQPEAPPAARTGAEASQRRRR